MRDRHVCSDETFLVPFLISKEYVDREPQCVIRGPRSLYRRFHTFRIWGRGELDDVSYE